MDREEVTRMALEAGFSLGTMYGQGMGKLMPISDSETLVRFAALIAAAERDRCAAECERMMMYPGGRQESAAHNNVWEAAKAIRALDI
jgi:hypothetical protein